MAKRLAPKPCILNEICFEKQTFLQNLIFTVILNFYAETYTHSNNRYGQFLLKINQHNNQIATKVVKI